MVGLALFWLFHSTVCPTLLSQEGRKLAELLDNLREHLCHETLYMYSKSSTTRLRALPPVLWQLVPQFPEDVDELLLLAWRRVVHHGDDERVRLRLGDRKEMS